jgi:hypothetical protein
MNRSIPAALALLLFSSPTSHASTSALSVTLGQSAAELYGPWKFRIGDDPRWSNSKLDDSGWDNMDLTPPPGATDGDVGLSGFAPGWSAKGYPGYHGFAWYRIHLNVTPPAKGTLALLGPWAVDSAYQIYANGTLLGGVGGFSGATPEAYSYHYPSYFTLPPGMAHGGPLVLAVRVWAGPWVSGLQAAGGIHIAPVIGERKAITAEYRLQWLKIFEGYVVDAVPGLLFALMAVMVACLLPFDRGDPAYSWMIVALLLSAIQRGNQAFLFWFEVESIRNFVYIILVLVGPLSFAAWTMAWSAWLKVDRPAWLPKAVIALTAVLMISEVLRYPWLFASEYPPWLALVAQRLIVCIHLAFLLLLITIICQGVRRKGVEALYSIPAILALGAVLFPGELVAVHVAGIWFPWGVGLSLSECASVVFDVFLFPLLVRRLWSCAAPFRNRINEL